MGVYEGRGQLSKALKQLMLRWTDTNNYWDDAASKHFEDKFIHSMEVDLRNAVGAMDHMAAVLAQVRRDCE